MATLKRSCQTIVTPPNSNSLERLPPNPTRLLLSTTYGLNRSYTKKLSVGYALDGKYFLPVVQINGWGDGIIMSGKVWLNFERAMDNIRTYVYTDKKNNPSGTPSGSPIDLKEGCSLSFVMSHGTKAVMLTKGPTAPEGESNGSTENETHEDSSQSVKKPKLDSQPTVVLLQKTSVDGLCRVIKCVSEQMLHLNSIVITVNRCKSDMVRELATVANSVGLIREPVGRYAVLVGAEFDRKQELLEADFKANFVKNYYNIVMQELKALFSYPIAQEIKALIDSANDFPRKSTKNE